MPQTAPHRTIEPIGTRVFIGKLAGTAVFDPVGDPVGTVSDVVVAVRLTKNPRAIGLVVDVAGRRRVFVPLTRVTSMKPGAVITTGLVNIRRFRQRPVEILVMGELMDRIVGLKHDGGQAKIMDMCMEQNHIRDWEITQLFVKRHTSALTFRRGETFLVPPTEVSGLFRNIFPQEATTLLATLEGVKAPDLADILRDLPDERRNEVAAQLGDERLADVLEELSLEDAVEIVSSLPLRRAADVLDVMQPDDAADLVGNLPESQATMLLDEMQPEEAEDVRRLMAYEDYEAGGLMTTAPVILSADTNVATLLAGVRRQDIPPALAAIVFVVRPPLETPTGRYIGAVHIQRALREPPQTLLGHIIDTDVEGIAPNTEIGTITRLLATYNLTALPVVDDANRLLGAVSVDDVLDHLLPHDWRDADENVIDTKMTRSANG
ncbi:MAG: CBS domain-containing protein [Actinomycetaceae bacterium]|nr:CBS domain-containing protein [Actinomycetaceae bacterium]